MNDFITSLQHKLTLELPGQNAQYQMAPMDRPRSYSMPEAAKHAGVLILFFWQDDAPHFVLIQRAEHPLDKHSKQISLPGGKYEDTDTDYAHTATRETEEEIGIPVSNIQLLGALTKLYIPVSNFIVHPYVGFITNNKPPHFIPAPSEVGEIIRVPIQEFLTDDNWTKQDLDIRGQTIKNIPIIQLQDKIVWGATSMILHELKVVLEKD